MMCEVAMYFVGAGVIALLGVIVHLDGIIDDYKHGTRK